MQRKIAMGRRRLGSTSWRAIRSSGAFVSQAATSGRPSSKPKGRILRCLFWSGLRNEGGEKSDEATERPSDRRWLQCQMRNVGEKNRVKGGQEVRWRGE